MKVIKIDMVGNDIKFHCEGITYVNEDVLIVDLNEPSIVVGKINQPDTLQILELTKEQSVELHRHVLKLHYEKKPVRRYPKFDIPSIFLPGE